MVLELRWLPDIKAFTEQGTEAGAVVVITLDKVSIVPCSSRIICEYYGNN